LDDEIRRTDKLRQSSDDLHSPFVAAINKRVPAVAQNYLQVSDISELQQQKARLDELAALVKALSPAIVASDKQRVLLAAYGAHLNSWRAAVSAEYKKLWKNLVSRLLGAAALIGGLVIIGAIVRSLTRRHVRDSERRHIVLVTQRIVLWATIVIIAAFAFASDITSLATFFGLLAAGLAVALQSLILSAVGYFVLVGRRGIRLGDRVQISGVAGDVIDIGWLQFQIREIDTRTEQPTGSVVTFSNSIVLASPSTGLSRFHRADLKRVQVAAAVKAP
jgi:small-conductance mechanosensitive channel